MMKRILIVDDAATVRMYHRAILESAGYAVDEAVNGIEALEKALTPRTTCTWST
jgi:two-component system chemotaxis response regulator CheY